jgi:hypothetical protein
MICRHCARPIQWVRPYGAFYEDDRVLVHVDTYLCRCSQESMEPHAEEAA